MNSCWCAICWKNEAIGRGQNHESSSPNLFVTVAQWNSRSRAARVYMGMLRCSRYLCSQHLMQLIEAPASHCVDALSRPCSYFPYKNLTFFQLLSNFIYCNTEIAQDHDTNRCITFFFTTVCVKIILRFDKVIIIKNVCTPHNEGWINLVDSDTDSEYQTVFIWDTSVCLVWSNVFMSSFFFAYSIYNR